jgi:hypothetical protein
MRQHYHHQFSPQSPPILWHEEIIGVAVAPIVAMLLWKSCRHEKNVTCGTGTKTVMFYRHARKDTIQCEPN